MNVCLLPATKDSDLEEEFTKKLTIEVSVEIQWVNNIHQIMSPSGANQPVPIYAHYSEISLRYLQDPRLVRYPFVTCLRHSTRPTHVIPLMS
jgi:hypothetical protein